MELIGKLKTTPGSDLKSSSHFKEKTINIIKQIPLGKVTTYGTIALMAGLPRGARLVGGILHYNSQKYNLPWQRVVNRNGFISTICFDHTKMEQKEILESEGVVVSDDFMVDLEKFG